jgi:hypothetical protein
LWRKEGLEINSSKALAVGLVKASINLNGWKAMDGNWLIELERLGSSLASHLVSLWSFFILLNFFSTKLRRS